MKKYCGIENIPDGFERVERKATRVNLRVLEGEEKGLGCLMEAWEGERTLVAIASVTDHRDSNVRGWCWVLCTRKM